MKKAKLAGKPEANMKVLHPDDHSHVNQQYPLDADKKRVKADTPWEKGRRGRGTK